MHLYPGNGLQAFQINDGLSACLAQGGKSLLGEQHTSNMKMVEEHNGNEFCCYSTYPPWMSVIMVLYQDIDDHLH